ncbi:MAG: hypothetical protein HC834_10655 [Rhodospirillales bacterium]|nr:hypothetical protein [Rhodospirillales bacterium]
MLLVLLAAAMTLGTIMERLRQSAVLGYMLAGAILGPYAVGLVPDDQTIHLMAELGVALLLFSIGLEFNLAELRSLGVRPLVGGAIQIILTTLVVAALAMLAGLDTRPAIGVGIIVSMSSTEVVLSALSRRAETDSLHGRFALAVLLFQDVAVVPAVLLVTALASDGTAGDVAKGTGLSLLLIVAFIVAFFLISKFLLPHIVRFAAAARNREFGVIFALVAGLGSAWVAHALHLSPALGAFIAGVFLGESVIATQLRGDVTPFRTIFVTLFFATIGTFADLQWIASHAWQVALATAGVMAGKAIIVWLTGATLGMPHRPRRRRGRVHRPDGRVQLRAAADRQGGQPDRQRRFQPADLDRDRVAVRHAVPGEAGPGGRGVVGAAASAVEAGEAPVAAGEGRARRGGARHPGGLWPRRSGGGRGPALAQGAGHADRPEHHDGDGGTCGRAAGVRGRRGQRAVDRGRSEAGDGADGAGLVAEDLVALGGDLTRDFRRELRPGARRALAAPGRHADQDGFGRRAGVDGWRNDLAHTVGLAVVDHHPQGTLLAHHQAFHAEDGRLALLVEGGQNFGAAIGVGGDGKRRETLTAYLVGKVLAATDGRAEPNLVKGRIEALLSQKA